MIELQAIGNIGKDADQKTIGGKAYASFSICVTEKNIRRERQDNMAPGNEIRQRR